MKPEPDHAEALMLRGYVETIAELLGVEPAAAWSECGDPSTAYIALADRSPEHPGRLLMLQWSSDDGWDLALEPESGELPVTLAAWPDPPRPPASDVASWVRRRIPRDV